MEELDDLKLLWQQAKPGFEPKKEEEIASMIKGRSNSIISKLKRSVWFELTFTILCGVALGGVCHHHPTWCFNVDDCFTDCAFYLVPVLLCQKNNLTEPVRLLNRKPEDQPGAPTETLKPPT
jgi:hypothetical protein